MKCVYVENKHGRNSVYALTKFCIQCGVYVPEKSSINAPHSELDVLKLHVWSKIRHGSQLTFCSDHV